MNCTSELCPQTPNGVSSRCDPQCLRFIQPFKNQGPKSYDHLKMAIIQLPRFRMTQDSPASIQGTFRSLIFRFVDLIQFHLDSKQELWHIHSKAQLGYSDLGVNRKRVERIRTHYELLEKK